MTATSLYWDATDKRFVFIVNTPPRVKHHKLPRSVHTEDEALAYIRVEILQAA